MLSWYTNDRAHWHYYRSVKHTWAYYFDLYSALGVPKELEKYDFVDFGVIKVRPGKCGYIWVLNECSYVWTSTCIGVKWMILNSGNYNAECLVFALYLHIHIIDLTSASLTIELRTWLCLLKWTDLFCNFKTNLFTEALD